MLCPQGLGPVSSYLEHTKHFLAHLGTACFENGRVGLFEERALEWEFDAKLNIRAPAGKVGAQESPGCSGGAAGRG